MSSKVQVKIESHGTHYFTDAVLTLNTIPQSKKRTLFEVADLQREHFGEDAEPFYPRIVTFFQTVESYGFVTFVKRIS